MLLYSTPDQRITNWPTKGYYFRSRAHEVLKFTLAIRTQIYTVTQFASCHMHLPPRDWRKPVGRMTILRPSLSKCRCATWYVLEFRFSLKRQDSVSVDKRSLLPQLFHHPSTTVLTLYVYLTDRLSTLPSRSFNTIATYCILSQQHQEGLKYNGRERRLKKLRHSLESGC